MIHSDEQFMEEREADQSANFFSPELLQEEQQVVTHIPVIDMNTLLPKNELVEYQFGDKPEKFNLTSADIANKIISAITEGHVDAAQFAVRRKLINDAFDIVMKDKGVKDIIVTSIEHAGKEGLNVLGAKISTTSRPVYKYEFDPTWKAIKTEMAPMEERLKAQEERVKVACKNNASLVDEEGVMIASIVPAPATESIAVSFSKRGKK